MYIETHMSSEGVKNWEGEGEEEGRGRGRRRNSMLSNVTRLSPGSHQKVTQTLHQLFSYKAS